MAGLSSIAGLTGRAFDYLTPGVGSNRLTDAAGWGDKNTSSPTVTINTGQRGGSTPYVTPGAADATAKYDALLKQSMALQAQLALQPKLPKFNYAASMASAGATAANTVNPVYQDKLNQYLAKAQAALGQKTTDVTRKKEDIGTALTQALEDTLLSRTQTNEDVTNKLGDITANEGSFQRQEGRQFDAARMALLGETANAGLTESGIGQQQEANAIVDRNLASEDQTRQFDTQKRDTEVFKTRTLADLDKADTRQRGSAQRSTEQQDIDLNNFIQNAGLDEQDFRATNEAERIGAINQATQSAYQQIVAQTIASLAGSGTRAQDLALFKQVYGG